MKKRAMIDLETLGTKPGCVILEIGIVVNWNARAEFPGVPPCFHSHLWLLRPEDQRDRHVDPDTVVWWTRHPRAMLRMIARHRDILRHEMHDACDQIFMLLRQADEIWANSPSFDCAILKEFIGCMPDGEPWKFTKERDFRTAAALRPDCPYKPPRDAHGALADALEQARHLDRLGIWRAK